MPKRIPRPQPAGRSAGFLRRMTHGALLAMSLKAAQLAAEEASTFRVFDRGLVDRLKSPLTRVHE